MTNKLHFDFLVDKQKNTITMKREFAAERQLVWDAYTQSEILEQWFAPKPLSAKTKHMDFSEGGYWLYAMVEPNGKEHWGRTEFLSISPIDNYTSLDSFCDENGVLNTQLPHSNWDVTFEDSENNTLVSTIITYDSLEDLETVIQMGMKEGLISTLDRLDEYFSTLKP